MTRPESVAAVVTPPTGIPSGPWRPDTSAPTWLTTAGVAQRSHRSVYVIRGAAVAGELHGHQSTRNGRPLRKGKWLFHMAAVDAWLRGHDVRAQAVACGCAAVAGRGRRPS